MNEDADLLRRYAAAGAEDAFAALVQRHVNFVYACALRRVGGDRHAAEDVAQRVFLALARSAGRLAGRASLGGWLHTTTRNVAAQHVRGERRRRVRESAAHTMNAPDPSPAPDWEKLGPVLDEALDAMSESDREAVLLRFFQGCSYAEVGARLRLAENAARMRVDRALDRLRGALERGGITSTAGGLAVALAQQASVAAPAGLAAAATTSALAGAGTGGGLLAFLGLGPVTAGLTGVALVAGAGLYWAEHRAQEQLRAEIRTLKAAQARLPALRDENRQLTLAAAEVEELRRDDAALRALGTRVAEVRQAQAERTRAAEARQMARRRELESWAKEQDRLAQAEVDRMNKEGAELVREYKQFTAQANQPELDASARQQADLAAKALLARIQAKQVEIKSYLAAERARQAAPAKGAGPFSFRPGNHPSGGQGPAADPAAAPGTNAGRGEGRLQLRP